MAKLSVINGVLHLGDCRKCINALNSGLAHKDYSSYAECVGDTEIKRACKCCQKAYRMECAYNQELKRYTHLLSYAKGRCEHYGFTCEKLDTGDIAITTHVEHWIVGMKDFTEVGAFNCVLWHRSYYKNKSKCKSSVYPEYHIQFTRNMTFDEVLQYVAKHEHDKWGATAPSRDVAYTESSVIV